MKYKELNPHHNVNPSTLYRDLGHILDTLLLHYPTSEEDRGYDFVRRVLCATLTEVRKFENDSPEDLICGLLDIIDDSMETPHLPELSAHDVDIYNRSRQWVTGEFRTTHSRME